MRYILQTSEGGYINSYVSYTEAAEEADRLRRRGWKVEVIYYDED